MKIKAKPNNKIIYRQDFSTHITLPIDVIFNVCEIRYEDKEKLKIKYLLLEAPGYGLLINNHNLYGNGKIYLYFNTLSKIDQNKILKYLK